MAPEWQSPRQVDLKRKEIVHCCSVKLKYKYTPSLPPNICGIGIQYFRYTRHLYQQAAGREQYCWL